MAGTDVQGMLIRIEATTAQLRQELNRADGAVAGSGKKIDKSLSGIDLAFDRLAAAATKSGKVMGTALAGISVAAAGVGTASLAMLKQTAGAVAESDRWAKSLGVSTQSLIEWQYAASRAGLEGDKIADIFKDLNDKIGEAATEKSGEAVAALNALGLSSEKLVKLSPDKQLLAIAQGLGKISTTAQKTTILESLGDDLSRMLPLLEDGGKKLKQYMQQARDFGIALDPKQIDDLVKANEILSDLEAKLTGIKNEFAAGLASIDITPLNNAMDSLRRTVTDPKFVQGVVDITTSIVNLTTKTIEATGEFANFAKWMGEALAAKIHGPALDDLIRLEDRVSSLTEELEKAKSAGGMPALFDDFGASSSRSIQDIQKDLDVANERLRVGRELAELASKPQGKANPVDPKPTVITASTENLGGTNGKPATVTEEAGQKRLANLRQQNAALQAQYDSINAQTGKVVTLGQQAQALAKWEQELADLKEKKTLTAEQKSILANAELLTAQYKRNAELEKEVDLRKKSVEEAAKLKSFVDNLNQQISTVRQDQAGALAMVGMGSKEAQRYQDLIDIRQEYQRQQDELLAQRNSGDISPELYDKETQALSAALQERLQLQQNYYKQVDDAQADWSNGASAAFQDYLDSARDVSSQTYSLFSNAFSNMEDGIVDFVKTGKLSFKDFADSLVEDLIRIQARQAAAGLLSSAFGGGGGGLGSLFGGGTTTSRSGFSEGGSYTFNAKGGVYDSPSLSAFSGGVYDSPQLFAFAKGAGVFGEAGPEAIMPLTRGPDGTLGVRAHDSGSGGGSNVTMAGITQHITVSGNADAATVAQVKEAARQGAQEGYNLMLQDFRRNGPARQMLSRG